MGKTLSELMEQNNDPTKYKTYLEQLGIKYPTVRGMSTAAGQDH